MARSNRMRINVVGSANKHGGVDKLQGTKKRVVADSIVAIASDKRGTVLKLAADGDDLVIGETLDVLVRDSGGALIKLTPVGFEDMRAGEDHSARGDTIAVNPDVMAFKAWPDGGSVVSIEGVARGILVTETPDEIEALLDA